ncbi:hypothetical protein BSR29_02115 [Boudabousia liubingyangii]|uniref:Uncharacterized protein n=1 Tax=Boudabousia liubingyangii TaxID=1921764 RepID=A0A1Q5PQB9_9ACTO|nr:hypothetical protein [Boudabousia liubingyangii]OKL48200.1 hypothetical protein BSR28_00335 [Boudabousia liubingyangii]OKL49764.1 hypothetical protein BSR29_02115 [Boudabousia liubingyangii]
MAKQRIESRMPNWVAVIIALVLVGIMGGTSYYIWYDLRHPAPITHAGAVAPSEEAPAGTATPAPTGEGQPGHIAKEAPQVKVVAGLRETNPEDYPAEGGIVRFRSASGNEVCAYAKDLNRLADDPWVSLSPTADGKPYQGEGVVCTQVRGALEPKGDDRHQCQNGELRGRSATLGVNQVNFGACVNGDNPTQADAKSEKNERFNAIKEIPNGAALKLGDRFICGTPLPDLTCVDLQTGRAFSIQTTGYKLFPPVAP